MPHGPRTPRHLYTDPLDQIWLGAAARIGFRVTRSADAYAATDGRRTISVGTAETLDPDDCLAQMILHELCHALVEGEDSWDKTDWGLDNQTDRDGPREEACLRTQAALTAPFGLRWVLAPTTDWRAFYDALPEDPLSPAWDAGVQAAKVALGRADRSPVAPHLGEALAATAEVVQVAAAWAPRAGDQLTPLLATTQVPRARHASGFFLPGTGTAAATETCASCGWFDKRRCRQSGGQRVRADLAACERWEPALDCQTCGACCREAYGSVSVGPRDPVRKTHPDLIVIQPGYLEVKRDGTHCAALAITPSDALPSYACRIYDDRPRTCREFPRGGTHCLTARRRVGLSR